MASEIPQSSHAKVAFVYKKAPDTFSFHFQSDSTGEQIKISHKRYLFFTSSTKGFVIFVFSLGVNITEANMHEDSIERVCIAATTSTNTREEKADTVEGVYVIYKAQKRYMRKVAKLFNVLL